MWVCLARGESGELHWLSRTCLRAVLITGDHPGNSLYLPRHVPIPRMPLAGQDRTYVLICQECVGRPISDKSPWFPLPLALNPLTRRRDTAPWGAGFVAQSSARDTVPCRGGRFGREETAFRTWYYSRGHPPIFLETRVPAWAGRRYSFGFTISLVDLGMGIARRMSSHCA